MTFTTHLVRRPTVAPAPFTVATAGSRLVRKFIATGDTRCPLIGVWTNVVSTITQTAAAIDETELLWPVLRALLPMRLAAGRALHPTFAIAC